MELTVGELCSGLSVVLAQGDEEFAVAGVTDDSRQAATDILFVAVPGSQGDGHDYLSQAIAGGCRAIAVQNDRWDQLAQVLEGFSGTVIRADETRSLPAYFGRRLNGNPDANLMTAAVTGTNGKTTVSFLLREMLNRLQGPCGLMGTISYEDGLRTQPAPLTTPGGPVFYSWLARMVDSGCRSVAMELSSHGLDQGRTAGLELDVAVMTNLGRDHLDYHHDMAEYLAAKARIIELLRDGAGRRPGTLVINQDDPQLASLDCGQATVVRFSSGNPVSGSPDLRVVSADLQLTGTSLEMDWRGARLEIDSPLVGRFNVENLAAAMAGGLALGFDPDECATALGGLPQVPGRMERFILPAGGLAIVDYAHTHDALSAVLAACDELSDGSLLVVFGCGGDRDRGKRPLMGRVAARDSDRAWITSDNPRGEEPGGIIRDIMAGFDEVREPHATGREIFIDRREAIEAALTVAGPGDIVVVAGKGHEDYQLIGDRVIELDDRVIIKEWIERNRDHG